jgi:hypothetical protein
MMTVLDDRIEMADTDADTKRLDEWFERLERMPVPEGYKVEIVGGTVHMTPQRDTHWVIIRRIVRALEDRFGMKVKVFSDVRIDFPGHESGFCPTSPCSRTRRKRTRQATGGTRTSCSSPIPTRDSAASTPIPSAATTTSRRPSTSAPTST